MSELYAKDSILEDLKKHDLKIVFTKADGSERTLIATNNVPTEHISKPKDKIMEQPQKKPTPDTHLKVFDRESQAWRTIVIERIKEVSNAE